MNERLQAGFPSPPSDLLIPYDAYKADLFAATTTLFIMFVRCNPFKRATLEDPYFKRLQSTNPEKFWNIFMKKNLPSDFKDLFQKGTSMNEDSRLSLQEALHHPFIKQNANIPLEQVQAHLAALFTEIELHKTESPKHNVSEESFGSTISDEATNENEKECFTKIRTELAQLV